MSSIIILRPHELEEKRSSKGMYVHLNRAGLVLLMVCDKDHYTICHPFIECITELVMRLPNCSYAMIDIHHHPEVIQKFERSDMPIQHIPFIMLYHNGIPYTSYDGPPHVNELIQFIQHTVNVTRMQQHTRSEQTTSESNTTDNVLTVGLPSNSKNRRPKYARRPEQVDVNRP